MYMYILIHVHVLCKMVGSGEETYTRNIIQGLGMESGNESRARKTLHLNVLLVIPSGARSILGSV